MKEQLKQSVDGNTDKILERVDAAASLLSDSLNKLAEKLGVTVDYLWPTFVKYEMAKGIALLSIGLVLASLSIFGLVGSKKKIADAEMRDEDAVGAYLLACLLFACVFGSSLMLMYNGIPSIIAPEPGALKTIAGSIRGF